MIGTTVGKYRILARLGRGGMGTVYRAIDDTLDREVAIKVLNSEVSDAKLMARFRAEATMLARLNHPEIATIFEIVQTETDLMMVMELVRGETFDQLSIRSGPLPPERAAYLMTQVLNGLAYAHRAGIVHRDLKPANVMVTESGTIKIMDFGIARVLGAEHLTTDGSMMGTPAYMAPEQVLGKDVDARADLYSAGVVFYRLLTGCLPFQADTPIGMVQKQLWEPPTPVRSYRADLPEWCETVMTRALAKAPEERFQNAEEFRSALLSVMGHSTGARGVHSSASFPAVAAPAIPPVPPRTLTPSSGLTPAELAAAPTVTLVRTPTPHDIAMVGNPAKVDAAPLQSDVVSSGPLDAVVPSPALANAASTPTQGDPPAGVRETHSINSPAAAAPSPVAVTQPSASTNKAPRSPVASPAAQARRRYILAAAAVLAFIGIGSSVLWLATRSAPSVVAVSETPAPAAPTVPVPEPATPETTAPVVDVSASASTPPDVTTTMPATGNGVPVATNGASGAAAAPRPAASRPAPKAEVPPPAPPAEATTPPPATAVTPPPAIVNTPESTVPAGAAAMPPVVFSAQTVVVEGGKNRQRDTNVELANGLVTVKGKDNKLVTTVPYDAVVGFTYSNSKQPMWNTPQGPAEIVHIDGGAFGFFKGDQHWVSLRTDGMSLVLHLRDEDSRKVIAAFEERIGKPVERVSERKDR